jgi:hypothetical protein
MASFTRYALALGTAASTLALVSAANAAGTPNGSRTMGLVVTHFYYATLDGKDDCPNGPTQGMRRLALPTLKAKLPPAELARVMQPEHEQDLVLLSQAFALGGVAYQGAADVRAYLIGPKLSKQGKGEVARQGAGGRGIADQCLFPTEFDNPPLQESQAKVGFGLDLDGGNASCPHQEFTSPAGLKGVDNQMQRVIGCIDGYRHDVSFLPGALEDYSDGSFRDGAYTSLIEITGVDDLKNDPDVQVTIWDSKDATPFDSKGKGMSNYSLTARAVVDGFANTAKGRIVDGVLTTDPAELATPRRGESSSYPYRFRGARLELKIAPDGSASGLLAGYMDIAEAYKSEVGYLGRFVTAQAAEIDMSCPAFFKALHKLADGYKDPATGKCTALSTAFKLDAVPAFVIHPDPEPKTAELPKQAAELTPAKQ